MLENNLHNLSYNLFIVLCLGLLSAVCVRVCVCVKNREAKITRFQMFHLDTCPLERMETRILTLHVRKDRHTYIRYIDVHKHFTFIHVGLKEGTFLTTLGSHPFRSKIVLHVSFQGQHQLQAWLPWQALQHAVHFYFHD